MLFSFASAFFLQAVRYGRAAGQLCDAEPLSDRLLRYIEDHSDTVTLKALSDRFFYQPGYLSALIKRKFGKSFTALLSDQRMKKGGILLKNTSLSVEEIARDRLQQCQQLLPLLPEILPYVAAGIRRTVFLKGGAYPKQFPHRLPVLRKKTVRIYGVVDLQLFISVADKIPSAGREAPRTV